MHAVAYTVCTKYGALLTRVFIVAQVFLLTIPHLTRKRLYVGV